MDDNTNPLVLYLSDPTRPMESLDAAAAKELLLERFPGADAVPCQPGEAYDYESPRGLQAIEAKNLWQLGTGWMEGSRSLGMIPVMPTPDASMAMQVWAILDFCASTPCQHYPAGCRLCEHRGEYRCAEQGKDAAPTWLRYLDDAVCGRLPQDQADAFWAWGKSHDPHNAAGLLMALQTIGLILAELLPEGRAILRARERWEQEPLHAPIEQVDASLRAAGGDPEAIGERGEQLIRALSESEARRGALDTALAGWFDEHRDGCPTCSFGGEMNHPGHDDGCVWDGLRELAEQFTS